MKSSRRATRHMSYRQSVYRRRKIKYILTILGISLAVIFLLFLIIGNILDRKVSTRIENLSDINGEESTNDTNISKALPSSVFAKPTALSAEGSSLSSRLNALAREDIKAVCFELDDSEGNILYSSKVAQGLGYQKDASSLWKLENAMENFDSRELYSIGITHVFEVNSDDDLTRAAAIGYHSARITEALRCGVDEILIYAPSLSYEMLTELTELANNVHRLYPKSKIGISVPYILSDDPENAEGEKKRAELLIDTLWQEFDFLAVDITSDMQEDKDSTSIIEDRIGKMLYYILRYNVRILLPTQDSLSPEQILGVCSERGINNLQFMP